MSGYGNQIYLCPNGHGGPQTAEARFCPACGAPYVLTQPPAPQFQPNYNPQYAPNGGYQQGSPQTMPQPPGISMPPQPPGISMPPQPPGISMPPQPPGISMPPQSGMSMPPQTGMSMPGRAPDPQQQMGVTVATPVKPTCTVCGGDGGKLGADVVICTQCRWLRPLAPGYFVNPSAFQSGADTAAMAKLRTIAPIMAAARTVSDKVGRRWVETSFNAILLGENQLPQVYAVAVRAARILGLPVMPDIYVSGDQMWEAVTYGSDNSSFAIIGTALINNFKGDDLLFLMAREMGHCRAGHALWKTVKEFLVGQHTQGKGIMSQGVLAALNPTKLVEGAIEVPFLAWARQAEITADRAGLLAVGDEEVARRVLLAWSLRSLPLYKQINIDAWLQQQEDSDEHVTRIAEILNSPTPFITRRLKLMTQFAQSPELASFRELIGPLDTEAHKDQAPEPPAAAPKKTHKPAEAATALPDDETPASDADAPPPPTVRVVCPTCGTGMRVPKAELDGKDIFRVRCPKPECGKLLTLKKSAAAQKS